MKTRVLATIATCLIIVTALSLLPGGILRRRLALGTNSFETALTRQLTSKAAGGVYDTTDHYLKPLQIPHPSETLLKAMEEIPPDDAVIFIAASDDESSGLIHHTVSYLGWPRQIGEVRCGAAGAPTEAMWLPRAGKPVKWLMFYRIVPPPDLTQAAKKIGPHLTLAPASELQEWKSYCSR